MDLWRTQARIACMSRPRWLLLVTAVAVSAALLPAASAQAAIGVESVSRSAGTPGTSITLDVGCGFCFPPCVGPPGHRHPAGHRRGACMLGSKAQPPKAFPISLVPVDRAPKPHRCGRKAVCPPSVASGPPTGPPYALLGRAMPPRRGSPHYYLRFRIPELAPGVYAYVIYCGVCLPGKRGALITYPTAPEWRLRIWATNPAATIDDWLSGLMRAFEPTTFGL